MVILKKHANIFSYKILAKELKAGTSTDIIECLKLNTGMISVRMVLISN